MRENGGEMLKRHGRGERCDRRLGADKVQSHLQPVFERLQIITGIPRKLVEDIMLTTVDRFLGGETLDFLGQLGRRAVTMVAHGFNKEGFALGEGRRQRVVEGSREGIAAMPPMRRLDLAREAPVAGRDAEIDWRHSCGAHHSTPRKWEDSGYC